jgi:hypothetical protein
MTQTKTITFNDIKNIVDVLVPKVLGLTTASFGKFTAPNLPDDYLSSRWENKGKDFTEVWCNFDYTHIDLFLKYCGLNEICGAQYVAQKWFEFCWNYDAQQYYQNPFKDSKNAAYYTQLATGSKKSQGVKALQIFKCYNRISDDTMKMYFIHCAFAAKKTES